VLFLSVALSITQQPNSYHPAFNDTNFVITESSGGIYTKDNFKFIADVKVAATTVAKLKAPIYFGSTNKGVFNIGRILESYVTNNWEFTDSSPSGCVNSFTDYEVEFGYEYSPSPTGTITEYLDLTSATGTVWNASLNPFDLVTYAEGQYLATSTSAKFLTNVRTRTIHRTQKDWLYCLKGDATSVLITYSDASTQTFSLPSSKVVRIPVGSQLTIPGGATFFDVVLKAGGTSKSETYRFNIKDECSKYETTDIFFMNRLGGFESFRFNMVRRDNFEVTRKQFQQNPYTLGATYGYQTSARTRTNYHTETSQKIKLFSNWINDTESVWLKDLIESPVVYMYDGTLYAVNIDNANYEQKKTVQDRMFNLELDITLSFADKSQRI
jgi:hypothetical protein